MNLARSGSLTDAARRGECCDNCGGPIGGARLFCLDCVIKGTETHNTVDLCCAPACVIARITHRQDLEAPHEPGHRLVKVRTNLLTRQHGRAYTAAQAAFTKVENFCKRIAEASQEAQENEKEEQTVSDAETAPSSESILSETPSEDDKPENGAAASEDTTSGTEGVTVEPSPAAPEDTSGVEGVEDTPQKQEQETLQGTERAKKQNSDLPSCGQCKGRLTFPCWYCVKCKGRFSSSALRILGAVAEAFLSDDLFLCDACDGGDVASELMRSSGMHTEHHHLIRCQAPKKAEEVTVSTEQRLKSLEDRLVSLETRLDSNHSRIETIEQLLRQLTEAVTRLSPRT